MRRLLVRGGVLGGGIGFVEDEPGRILGRLEDVEAAVAGLSDGIPVIGAGRLDERGDGFRLDADVDQRDVHGALLIR